MSGSNSGSRLRNMYGVLAFALNACGCMFEYVYICMHTRPYVCLCVDTCKTAKSIHMHDVCDCMCIHMHYTHAHTKYKLPFYL